MNVITFDISIFILNIYIYLKLLNIRYDKIIVLPDPLPCTQIQLNLIYEIGQFLLDYAVNSTLIWVVGAPDLVE